MTSGFDTRAVPERQRAEALFLENLPWIERVAASLCRRYGLAGDEADDAASWIKLKLIEDDYASLRKFRGESSVRTYLTVVTAALFRDYRVSHWGRWRPSAAALRRGRLAVRLETLVYRDGCSLDQAARALRAAGETDMSDRELASLLSDLPVRAPVRPVEVGSEPLSGVPAAASATERVDADAAERERRVVHDALVRALDRLPPEDRTIMQMQYWNGLSVADVARGLNLPQKPLYRRIERILHHLRGDLEADGVSRDQLRGLLDDLPP